MAYNVVLRRNGAKVGHFGPFGTKKQAITQGQVLADDAARDVVVSVEPQRKKATAKKRKNTRRSAIKKGDRFEDQYGVWVVDGPAYGTVDMWEIYLSSRGKGHGKVESGSALLKHYTNTRTNTRTTRKKELSFPNSNLYLVGMGKDTNGNSVIKLKYPNSRAFSIQLVGTDLHDLFRGKRSITGNERPSWTEKVEKEVIYHIRNFGSLGQKQGLRVYRTNTRRTRANSAIPHTKKAFAKEYYDLLTRFFNTRQYLGAGKYSTPTGKSMQISNRLAALYDAHPSWADEVDDQWSDDQRMNTNPRPMATNTRTTRANWGAGSFAEKPVTLIFSTKEKANAFKKSLDKNEVSGKFSTRKTKGWNTYSLIFTPHSYSDVVAIRKYYRPEKSHYKDIERDLRTNPRPMATNTSHSRISWGGSGGVVWGKIKGSHDVFTIERPSVGQKWVLKFYEDGKSPASIIASGHDAKKLQARGDRFYALQSTPGERTPQKNTRRANPSRGAFKSVSKTSEPYTHYTVARGLLTTGHKSRKEALKQASGQKANVKTAAQAKEYLGRKSDGQYRSLTSSASWYNHSR